MEDFPDVVIQGSLSFIVTDAPRHKELRGIVWSAFTPGNMRKLEHDIAAQAKQIVDEIAPLGEADLATTLCKQLPGRQAQTEDGTLEDWEVGSFFALLSAAANDTTRHTIAHTIWNFERFPEQKKLWQDNITDAKLGEQLAEEAVRYATPLMHFRRTVTQDVEFGGVEMKEGDKVALWYCSGNRDEKVFDRPMEFDITREVNRHVGFGGGGPHYCMGAALARLTLRSIFREIYTRMSDIRVVETPRFLDANVVHGVKELRAEWTPER